MLNWDFEEALLRMSPGDSFFIPTLEAPSLMRKISGAAKRLGVNVMCKEAIHEGALGVRTWHVIDSPKSA